MTRGTGLILALAVAAAGLLGPASCPKRPITKPLPPVDKAKYDIPASKLPELGRGYHDDALHLTVSLPEGWGVVRNRDNPYLLLSPPDAGTYGPLANVVVESLGKSMDPYDYLASNIFAFQATMPGLKIEKWAIITVNQRMMGWIQYSYPAGSVIVNAVAYCQTQGTNAYVVTALAPSGDFTRDEYLFHAIGRSLRLD
jgi:hypothetical protein